MPKIKNPGTFSGHFKVPKAKLTGLGVFDPTLAVDTRLFIDPFLFEKSKHSEISTGAVNEYRKHFETVIRFLSLTKKPEDIGWRTARRLLEFHEVRGTCLGYGINSIGGSGFGSQLTERVLRVGKEIVDLGIQDPDLFAAMALFEEKIGADRVSDMTTNVVRQSLVTFNRRILKGLKLRGEIFDMFGVNARFVVNPFQSTRTPVILVPADILRKLPIARDWDEVADAAYKNDRIRQRVNDHISHIWAKKAKRDKARLRAQALANQVAFQTLLDAMHDVPLRAYDPISDPEGLLIWASKAKEYVGRFPLPLSQKKISSVVDLHKMVVKIVAQFRQLVEHNGLNRELYKDDGAPRHESTAQRLFFAIAYSYCEANNLDISPEVDSGNGQVDFKLSKGFNRRVLVEVKLSSNPKVVPGYKKQLEAYKRAEQTMRAIYLVIDVGGMGKKEKLLAMERNEARARREPLSDLEFIDGIVKPSASKLS
jgi:hypothetical protein